MARLSLCRRGYSILIMGSRNVIGNLWVTKDDKNRTYLRGYLFLTVRGRKRVYLTKILPNHLKVLPNQHDFTAYDYTEGKPKIKPAKKRID